MITMKSKTWMNKSAVLRAVRKAVVDPLDKAAMMVCSEAQKSMKGGGASGQPSPPGTPPNVQTGNLRASITWASINGGASRVCGPTEQAWYGMIHEWGGMFVNSATGAKMHFPQRPFMRPALERVRMKLAPLFRNLPMRRYGGGDIEIGKAGR